MRRHGAYDELSVFICSYLFSIPQLVLNQDFLEVDFILNQIVLSPHLIVLLPSVVQVTCRLEKKPALCFKTNAPTAGVTICEYLSTEERYFSVCTTTKMQPFIMRDLLWT